MSCKLGFPHQTMDLLASASVHPHVQHRPRLQESGKGRMRRQISESEYLVLDSDLSTYSSILWECVAPSHLSRVQLFVTRWTIAFQALQSMEFSRQEYWTGLPFLSPGDLPNPGIDPGSHSAPALQEDIFTAEPPRKSLRIFFFFLLVFSLVKQKKLNLLYKVALKFKRQ